MIIKLLRISLLVVLFSHHYYDIIIVNAFTTTTTLLKNKNNAAAPVRHYDYPSSSILQCNKRKRSIITGTKLFSTTMDTTDTTTTITDETSTENVNTDNNSNDNDSENNNNFPLNNNKKKTASPHLWFDSKEGSLKIDESIKLLDGISPSSWSIKKNASNSLFLQLPSPTKPITIETNTLHHSLGNLVSGGNNYRWLACSRINRYWMEPFFGGSNNNNNIIPFDTQFLLLEIEKKNKNASEQQYYYALLLPLVDGGYRASLKGEKKR